VRCAAWSVSFCLSLDVPVTFEVSSQPSTCCFSSASSDAQRASAPATSGTLGQSWFLPHSPASTSLRQKDSVLTLVWLTYETSVSYSSHRPHAASVCSVHSL
jgi:hypothetical protein